MPPAASMDLFEDETESGSSKTNLTSKSTSIRNDFKLFKQFFSDPLTVTGEGKGRRNKSHKGNFRLCVAEKLPQGKPISGLNSFNNFGKPIRNFHSKSAVSYEFFPFSRIISNKCVMLCIWRM